MVAHARIRSYAEQVARLFRPERIVLFGSHASAAAAPDSDVDLLIVMEDGGDPIGKATEIRCAIPRDFPLDLIVRDPQTLRSRIESNDWFLRDIVENGTVLYEAGNAGMG